MKMAKNTAKKADAAPEQDEKEILEDVLKGVSEAFDDMADDTAKNAESAQEDPPLDPVEANEEMDAAATADLLAARVAELEEESGALKDRMMRALADAENTRRRAERDKADALAFGGSKLAKDLLPVLDNLDRALKAADDNLRETAKDFIEGVELTRRELINAFAKHKIEAVEPELGEKFDPNLHQAMFEAPVPGAKAGTVIDVVQTGFTIAGRLLRPASVGVAKAIAEPAPEETPSEE
jgi:molecular chaperone GrpE